MIALSQPLSMENTLKRFSSFDIKRLAFAFMLVDHVGRMFFPEFPIFVAIGRLSFPLFAWLAIIGEKHTRNLPRYLFRLIGLGLITQPIYSKVWNDIFGPPSDLNILFTLALGVLVVRLAKQQDELPGSLIVIAGAVLAEYARFEGGAYSLLELFFISKLADQPGVGCLSLILLNLIFVGFLGWNPIQLFSLLAVPIMLLYNGERGAKARWFYLLYPLHFLVLWLIKEYSLQ